MQRDAGWRWHTLSSLEGRQPRRRLSGSCVRKSGAGKGSNRTLLQSQNGIKPE